ncbi:type II secretion system protein N [Sphingobium sufflavum]|uniref:type II secretion system protein N n=1 Tax=Sphingobium sufflavum TaxID=1129547 RepID=UPI001F2B8ED2|nr:type II secretion system protein N [Sphingobium sufflavum]MCE7797496.1 type II secretion system protein N [Sphingobium sufflavum]
MMRWLNLSPRGRNILAVALLLALVGAMPLRMLFALVDAGEMGIAARSVRGPVWWGAAEELQAGPVRIGTVDVMLSPLHLLLGRARLDIRRKKGLPDDIEGALTAGVATRGIDDMTGTLPMGGALSPLPVSTVEMQDVSIAFSGSRCVRAEGRMRAMLSAGLPGMDLANGLSGAVRCDGTDLLIALVSQSGVERIELRVDGAGRYRGGMTVAGGDPLVAVALGAAGFRPVGANQRLDVSGSL